MASQTLFSKRICSFISYKHRILLNNATSRLYPIRNIATLPKPVNEITHPDSQVSPADLDTIELYEKYLVLNRKQPNILFDHGKGVHLYDTLGRDYLDFTAGVSVNALGHADSMVCQDIYDQARKMIHSSRLFHDRNTGRLAELLIKKTRETDTWANKVLLTDSGREALKLIIKIARTCGEYTGGAKKTKIVCFESSSIHHHDQHDKSQKQQQQQRNQDIVHIPFNHPLEMYHAIDEDTCAAIIQPIQSKSGIHVASSDFLEALRERCYHHNALLIYDESECGMGRTGKLWAHQHYDKKLSPDALIVAKSMANGVPIGAIIASRKVVDMVPKESYGDGGNPLTAAVALGVVKKISNNEFMYHVNEVGQVLIRDLKALEEEFPELIKQVRGKGLLLGVEFKQDPTSVIKYARQRGLLLTNMANNTIGFTPPLILTKDEAREGIARFSGALERFYVDAKQE